MCTYEQLLQNMPHSQIVLMIVMKIKQTKQMSTYTNRKEYNLSPILCLFCTL